MEPSGNLIVVGEGGLRGSIDPATQSLDQEAQVLVRMNNGQQVMVPVDLLDWQPDGTYYLPLSLEQLEAQQAGWETTTSLVVPVIAEELHVRKRQYKSGGVRISKRVRRHEELVDEPGYRERIEVDRVRVNEFIDAPAQVHYDGDTMVVPLMEEVYVVEKRLLLKEEVRITKYREEIRRPQKVSLRSEEVQIEEIDLDELNQEEI